MKQILRENPVREKLEAGKPAVGGWVTLCSAEAAEALASVGWDWVAVDIEHSPVGIETLTGCFRAIQLAGSIPMARVPWNEPIWIQRTLDAGAMGLIIPMVNSAEDAARAVSDTRYATHGRRSYGGSRLRTYVDEDYATWSARNVLCIPMIETIQAVERAEEILSVDGVAACFVGPRDLALSMGAGDADMGPGAAHEAAMHHVLTVAQRLGVPAGKHCFDAAEVRLRIGQGWQFLALASDARFMLSAAQAEFEAVHLKDEPEAGSGDLY
ncbi:MAG: 2-dehydro-3-deoxyglucarate aldolase [Anaerolineae bacterium]|nr:2-dehydro-3-deoxyglucarate aldolase [Anaerolineae bacterium]